MIFLRARYYDPKIGRFIKKDPIGIEGGVNVYAYVAGNPLANIDPSGLEWFRPNGHPHNIGRPGTIVPPGGAVSTLISDYVPAGHTFAAKHDRFVGKATSAGFPDWLIYQQCFPYTE